MLDDIFLKCQTSFYESQDFSLFVSLTRAWWLLRMTVSRRCRTSSQWPPCSLGQTDCGVQWWYFLSLQPSSPRSPLCPRHHHCSAPAASAAPAVSWRPEVWPQLAGPGSPGHRLPPGGGRGGRPRHPRAVQSPPGWDSVSHLVMTTLITIVITGSINSQQSTRFSGDNNNNRTLTVTDLTTLLRGSANILENNAPRLNNIVNQAGQQGWVVISSLIIKIFYIQQYYL